MDSNPDLQNVREHWKWYVLFQTINMRVKATQGGTPLSLLPEGYRHGSLLRLHALLLSDEDHGVSVEDVIDEIGAMQEMSDRN